MQNEAGAIIKFICNPEPERRVGSNGEDALELASDAARLLLGLLRVQTPPPHLFTSLVEVCRDVNTLAALIALRFIDSPSDDHRSVGLRLISA